MARCSSTGGGGRFTISSAGGASATRQIGIRRQRLAFPFAVDHAQQRIEPGRAQPFGEFEIRQLSLQVGLRMHQFFKLRDGDLFYPGPGSVEIHGLVVVARGSADRQGRTSDLLHGGRGIRPSGKVCGGLKVRV